MTKSYNSGIAPWIFPAGAQTPRRHENIAVAQTPLLLSIKHYLRALFGGAHRGCKPGKPGADDEDIKRLCVLAYPFCKYGGARFRFLTSCLRGQASLLPQGEDNNPRKSICCIAILSGHVRQIALCIPTPSPLRRRAFHLQVAESDFPIGEPSLRLEQRTRLSIPARLGTPVGFRWFEKHRRSPQRYPCPFSDANDELHCLRVRLAHLVLGDLQRVNHSLHLGRPD